MCVCVRACMYMHVGVPRAVRMCVHVYVHLCTYLCTYMMWLRFGCICAAQNVHHYEKLHKTPVKSSLLCMHFIFHF